MLLISAFKGFPGSRGREVTFPPGTVEATTPLMLKRRKHTKVDVQPVDGWRLVMSLRSGLLMESTWALDVINILLYDDHAYTYFGLANMPGLLESLLEHWRASLIAMFGIMGDLELRSDVKTRPKSKRKLEATSCEIGSEAAIVSNADGTEQDEELDLGRVTEVDPDDKCVVLCSEDGQNFTKRPRFCEEDIEVVDRDDELFIIDGERSWDQKSRVIDCFSGAVHWMNGGGESTGHVITHFNSDLCMAKFVRVLKDLKIGECDVNNKDGSKRENAGRQSLSSTSASRSCVQSQKKSLLNGGNLSDEDDREPSSKVSSGMEEGPSSLLGKDGSENLDAKEDNDEKMEDMEDENEDAVDKAMRLSRVLFRDPEEVRKKWKIEDLEEENYVRDDPSLDLVTDTQDSIGRRAVCISTIFRNLSFVPGNEFEFSRNPAFLTILGRLILLHHWYPPRAPTTCNYGGGGDLVDEDPISSTNSNVSGNPSASVTAPQSKPQPSSSASRNEDDDGNSSSEWWWDYMHVIRENVMVILANISGSLDLSPFEEDICHPILDGLLEWAVSSSAYAQDPFPNVGPNSPVSPQRLAIESLCKLCILEGNTDLILSTPPYSRIEKLTLALAKKLYRHEDQVLREFSINLLYYLSGADTGVARTIATSDMTVGLLLGFIEQAEQNAMVVAQQHGVNALRDNPDSMGTSLDMLRRAALTLANLSRHPDNAPLFLKQEQRLLSLVMSQILDQGVASILSSVLFNVGNWDHTALEKPKEDSLKRAATAAVKILPVSAEAVQNNTCEETDDSKNVDKNKNPESGSTEPPAGVQVDS